MTKLEMKFAGSLNFIKNDASFNRTIHHSPNPLEGIFRRLLNTYLIVPTQRLSAFNLSLINSDYTSSSTQLKLDRLEVKV